MPLASSFFLFEFRIIYRSRVSWQHLMQSPQQFPFSFSRAVLVPASQSRQTLLDPAPSLVVLYV